MRREVAKLRLDREFLKTTAAFLRGRELEAAQAFGLIKAEKAVDGVRLYAAVGVPLSGLMPGVPIAAASLVHVRRVRSAR